jgi:hypothetical protein
MKNTILALLAVISFGYSQAFFSKADLENGILVAVLDSGKQMQLKDGEYTCPNDNGSYKVATELCTATAVTIIEYAGGGGSGYSYRIGCAFKVKGKTYISMGKTYAGKKAIVVNIQSYEKTVNIAMYEDSDDLWRDRKAPVIKVFNIAGGVPVVSRTPYAYEE